MRVANSKVRKITDTTFVIYAPRFDDAKGGAIVLHKLCHLLNQLGYSACLWPYGKPRFTWKHPLQYVFSASIHHGRRLCRKSYAVRDGFITPLSRSSDLDSCVVIYPEIVSKNPLYVEHYLRWLLHKPGFHSGGKSYFSGDLCFSFQKAFDASVEGMVDGGILRVYEYFRDIYKQINYGGRAGVCYVVRKGRNRKDLPDLKGLLVVDEMNHQQLSRVFNECRYCYFYDPYTMLSVYAALCGCIPIIVPMPGISKEEWKPDEELRYGLAYGEDDLDYAIATKKMMIARLDRVEADNVRLVERFISIVAAHFGLER